MPPRVRRRGRRALSGRVRPPAGGGRGQLRHQEARRYIASVYNGKPIDVSFGDPDTGGRAFYKQDFSALNFTVRRDRLDTVLTEIEAHLQDERPPMYYVASLPVDENVSKVTENVLRRFLAESGGVLGDPTPRGQKPPNPPPPAPPPAPPRGGGGV